jgi:hypothetical protein
MDVQTRGLENVLLAVRSSLSEVWMVQDSIGVQPTVLSTSEVRAVDRAHEMANAYNRTFNIYRCEFSRSVTVTQHN